MAGFSGSILLIFDDGHEVSEICSKDVTDLCQELSNRLTFWIELDLVDFSFLYFT